MKTYLFNGKRYGGNRRHLGLGRMVFDIIEDWAGKNYPASLGELTAAFPQNLNGSKANSERTLVVPVRTAERIHAEDLTQHRHVRDEGRLLTVRLGDGSEYAVCNQWRGDENMDARGHINIFVERARKMGCAVREATKRWHGWYAPHAQNPFMRYILSNLGNESFSEDDWKQTKAYFDGKCAYCGEAKELVREHVVPMNKTAMGEHRLGNLVPSCRECNRDKSDKDYRVFLADNPDALQRVEAYMCEHDYSPISDREDAAQVREILKAAYRDVEPLAEECIRKLNEMLKKAP